MSIHMVVEADDPLVVTDGPSLRGLKNTFFKRLPRPKPVQFAVASFDRTYTVTYDVIVDKVKAVGTTGQEWIVWGKYIGPNDSGRVRLGFNTHARKGTMTKYPNPVT